MVLDTFGMLAFQPKGAAASALLPGTQPSPLSVLDVFGLDSPGTSQYSPVGFGGGFEACDSPSSRPSNCSLPPVAKRQPSFSLAVGRQSPSARRGSKPRTDSQRSFSRSSSLNEKKVLLATQLKRTPSLMSPVLFHFEEHFHFEKLIGRSELSEVWRVRHRQTKELFAVKRSKQQFASRVHRESCLREIECVAALPAHLHVVGHYRAWQQQGHFYIQMELCEGGTLADQLQQAAPLTEHHVWQVLWEVAQGLQFLHNSQPNIIHLDIKPDNLFRDACGAYKIGDFGLAVMRCAEEWEEGDGNYLAPELLTDSDPTPAADVFSLGATLYQCMTGHTLPRSGDAWTATAAMPPSATAASLQWLVHQMCDLVPSHRPSARDIIDCIASLSMPFELRPLAAPEAEQTTDLLDLLAGGQEEATVSSPETPMSGPWHARSGGRGFLQGSREPPDSASPMAVSTAMQRMGDSPDDCSPGGCMSMDASERSLSFETPRLFKLLSVTSPRSARHSTGKEHRKRRSVFGFTAACPSEDSEEDDDMLEGHGSADGCAGPASPAVLSPQQRVHTPSMLGKHSRSHSSPSACTSSSKRMPQTELHSPDMLPSISAAPLSGPCSLRPVCRDVDDFRLAPRSPFADVQHLPGTPGLTFSAVDSPHMASPWLSPPIAWAPPRSACQQRQQQQPQPRSHCYANEQLGTPGGRCQHSLQTSDQDMATSCSGLVSSMQCSQHSIATADDESWGSLQGAARQLCLTMSGLDTRSASPTLAH